jgi:NAD(P)-dependent dehydrogenase (short-subunit alcohol dehydrogenase family)
MVTATFDYSSTVVMVTGGGSGIGLAMARAFGAAGASVAVADINAEAAGASADAIEADGGTARAFPVDVADEAALTRVVANVVDHFGALDVAVNNAGIEADLVPLAELDSANWRRVSDVNLSAVFYGMKAQIPTMLRAGGGVILNTASISGLIAGYNLAAYTATKHGVIGLTRGAAVDYAARGIRINALCPGLVDTPFIGALPQALRDRLIFGVPMGRPGRPEEMAQAALWLCSDSASYVTGHAMVVDGAASLGAVGTRFDDLEL